MHACSSEQLRICQKQLQLVGIPPATCSASQDNCLFCMESLRPSSCYVCTQVKGKRAMVEVYRVASLHPQETSRWQAVLSPGQALGSPHPSAGLGNSQTLGAPAGAPWAVRPLVGREDIMAQVRDLVQSRPGWQVVQSAGQGLGSFQPTAGLGISQAWGTPAAWAVMPISGRKDITGQMSTA